MPKSLKVPTELEWMSLHKALIELYLDVKVRSNDEVIIFIQSFILTLYRSYA
jgi:hypothetical protein